MSGNEDSDEEWVGPRPEEAVSEPKKKKRKFLQHEKLYLDNLPSSQYYEKSFMHRDTITHIVVTRLTEFVITGSCDGHIKFWKKQDEGIEFVKHFRAHLGNIQHLVANISGNRLVSISTDKSLKVFDVMNFDMINMMKMDYIPYTCEWINSSSDIDAKIAVSDQESSKIYIYDAHGTEQPLHILDTIHTKPVVLIKFNSIYNVTISVDELGMIEYWCGSKDDYKIPSFVKFESKLDTDLFEFVKTKSIPKALTISPNGELFATVGTDKQIKIFKFLTGKLSRVFDESISFINKLQKENQQVGNMEFARRIAMEKEVEKGGPLTTMSLLFDESGYFILYSTLLGIKMINLHTNRLVRTIGKPENLRLMSLALFQGKANRSNSAVTMEMEAAANPTLDAMKNDPILFATAFKKNRFFLFTTRDANQNADVDRDVFNERPTKEDIVSSTESTIGQRLYETAILHTSMGDIQLKLFLKECPKSVENFCVHAKNSYYNGHLFHRVIKQFMVQTGDPLGSGVGGKSIWGGEFEDEFHPTLRHDRPYTLSMANAGPNTNGSQFFITVVPSPWLDNKHTVFGRVVRGLEVVQNISNSKTNPVTDKPHDDIILISITVK